MSVRIIVPAILFGLFFGIVLGTLRTYGGRWVRKPANGFAMLIRGTPLVCQLLFLYYGLPNIGIYLEPLRRGGHRLHRVQRGLSFRIYPRAACWRLGAASIWRLRRWDSAISGRCCGSSCPRRCAAPCPGLRQRDHLSRQIFLAGLHRHLHGTDRLRQGTGGRDLPLHRGVLRRRALLPGAGHPGALRPERGREEGPHSRIRGSAERRLSKSPSLRTRIVCPI